MKKIVLLIVFIITSSLVFGADNSDFINGCPDWVTSMIATIIYGIIHRFFERNRLKKKIIAEIVEEKQNEKN